MQRATLDTQERRSMMADFPPEITDEVKAELARLATQDLRQRCIPSAIIYLIFMPIIAAGSPYLSMHGPTLLSFAIPITILNLGRLFLARYHDRFDADLQKTFARAFIGITGAVGVLWGLFGGVTIALYGFSWTSLFVIVVTTGLSAAAAASLAPSLMLARIYLGAMVMPSLIAAFSYGGQHGYTVGSLYIGFLGFVLAQARHQHAEYSRGLETNVMLRIKTRELAAAKEHAEAASRAKSQFLTTISHEIRTPMNGIVGMTDLALSSELTAEQREYLTLVQESADSLLTIINDMLDFADIEAGRLRLEQTTFDLRQQLDDALGGISLAAYQKGLEVIAHVPLEVPGQLVGDPGRLRQVIASLVGNAVKFTSQGDITLRVAVEEWADDAVTLRFSVSDTGVGIPPEKREMIFEAFTQADGSTTRKHGGTGLGLAISAQLVGIMGGRIWPEDNPGGGTTFHFTVRFGADRKAAEDATRSHRSALQGARVLLADDNPAVRRIMGETLSEWGVMVTTAHESASAIVRMHRAWDAGRPFGAALIDAEMPPSNALALLDLMQEQYLPPHGIIIMMPPGARAAEAALYRHRGVSACLRKPIRQRELIDALRAALRLDRANVGEVVGLRRKDAA